MKSKKEIFGQYFTKVDVVSKLLDIFFDYKKYGTNIDILEPAFGTGNFISELSKRGYEKIKGYEIDKDLTSHPMDFFMTPIMDKYDLIIGNPPFTKYNIEESYYYISKYNKLDNDQKIYLDSFKSKNDKQKIENIFILKSLKQLKSSDSSIGFVLPISFFIKNKNMEIKNKILEKFSTVIIYQDNKIWFDQNISCCFAVFTNLSEYQDKIIIVYDGDYRYEEVLDSSNINQELIPKIIFNKKHVLANNENGRPLRDYLSPICVKVNKSFSSNNVSAKNILDKVIIPYGDNVIDYKIAITRVGNSSVGKCGLINIKKDTLNDMFFVFNLKDEYNDNKELKEKICHEINSNIDYFKNITCRIGSKSIKKENIYDFRVEIE